MKKLVIFLSAAIFAATISCTTTSVEELDYENGIQLIDKEEVETSTDKKQDD